MSKLTDDRIALAALIGFAFWLLVVLPIYYSPPDACTAKEFTGFWEKTRCDPVAAFTAVLAVSTILLWLATSAAARRQSRDTEILQRAYISVDLRGIANNTAGYVLGHVAFRNVGHLPATDFRWCVEITPSSDGRWVPPEISESSLRRLGVVPIGAEVVRGPPAAISPPQNGYIYIWGKTTYLDGFGNRRFAAFCHRYNTAVKYIPAGGGYAIHAQDGRYHDHGNDAD